MECKDFKETWKLKEIRKKTDRYGIKLLALQEIRWKGEGMITSENHIFMYSEDITSNKGTRFFISRFIY